MRASLALDGGGAIARGGRIELGAIAGSGTVGLNVDGNDLSLSFPDGADRADISLVNGALVSINGEGGGDIQVEGRRITLSGGSQMSTVTLGAEKGGTLAVTASDAVEVIGTSADGEFPSGLFASSNGSGDAGDLTIDTPRLLVRDGAQISAATYGEGKGSSLLITASDAVEVIGTSADGEFPSGLFASSNGSGDAGDLTIDTPRLLVRDGALVSTATYGEGKGGSLQIIASDAVEVIGISADGEFPSGLFAGSEGSGDARDLTIDTSRLLVRDGARVSATTLGEGKGGSLQITASDSVEVIGRSADGEFGSGLFASTLGSAEAGNLTIDTSRLLVSGGARVSAGTFGEGKGGSLQITASNSVEVIGTSANGKFGSGLFTQSNPGSSGDAGNLTIGTRRLLVRDGAVVSATTFDSGNGGSLRITASDSVELIGRSANGEFSSGLFAQSEGSGDARNLTIDTARLLVSDGARVSASTFGEGKGGNLQITASDSVELIGTSADGQTSSALLTSSSGSGDAGDLRIDTGHLLVRDGAVISSGSTGKGIAGNLDITVRDTLEADNGTIRANTNRSAGGAIRIKAGAIRLFGNSDIRSNVASGAGGGGNIYLEANSILAFGDSDILAFSRDGTGGNITLDTRAFFGENYRSAPRRIVLNTLNGNNRVDVNATGAVEGVITLPDTTFIQNSLTELPDNQINTDSILASSCIVRRNQPTQGSFRVTGTGGLPQRPGDAQMSSFPTVDVETLPSDGTPSTTNPNRPWQKGDPIVEPQGAYRLPNGKLVLSRECS